MSAFSLHYSAGGGRDVMAVRELDPHIINLIAAGEVIERPASVVKELVENSLDAGSSRIEIAVRGGGMERITVSDDGCGMGKEDLLLAIRRHTTSKISSKADLDDIGTLGFRGEALASIVEVSRATITSRSGAEAEATRVEAEGGHISSARAEGRKRGTTIDIRDLFFHTPARRKFIKTERTEFTHIVRAVKRFVLSHPGVHLKLIHGEKPVLESPPARTLRDVIAHLYDADLARSLLDVEGEGRSVRVGGLVGPPGRSRADRNEQYFFINGRYVRDPGLMYGLSKAYEGLMEKDRHPIAFLLLKVDRQMVDVNVHPKKEEVRFSNAKMVQGELKRAVSNALLTRGSVPQMGRSGHGHPAAVPEGERGGGPYGGERERGTDPPRSSVSRGGVRGLTELSGALDREGPTSSGGESVLGQLHGTYLLVQTVQGLEIIDQHVAHERILFERYLAQLTVGSVPRQRLLIPLTLEFSPDQAEELEAQLPLLEEKLGIGLSRFGGGTFILRDWPEAFARNLARENAVHTLQRVLKTLEHEEDLDLEELARQMAAELACESAVVKNTRLSGQEMTELVAQLRQTRNPYRCPHGRPVIIAYPLEELERSFGRR